MIAKLLYANMYSTTKYKMSGLMPSCVPQCMMHQVCIKTEYGLLSINGQETFSRQRHR